MKEQTLNRFSPLQLGSRVALKNRVVVPPMASQSASIDGIATPATKEHYARLATSGAGLLLVEYTYVHSSGRSEDHQLGLSTDTHISGLSDLAKIIHQSGAIAGLQLTHSGGKSSRALTEGKLMGPSGIDVPVKGQILERPDPMSIQDIELWQSSFVEAASRALAAGFDLVEFHAAHGYGLNQWLSPITNQRLDEYGETFEGRIRILLEIIQRVKMMHPELLISVRIPGQDFLEGGLKVRDSIKLAKALENIGVNIINVSSGIGGWRRPSTRSGEGYLVDEAAEIQAALTIPVIGVGGIETGGYIDQGVQFNRFSLAAVGRAILDNPKAWCETHLSLNERN